MNTEQVRDFIASIESISETSLQREVAHVISLRKENAVEFMEYIREYGSREADVIELWWTLDILTFYRHHQHDIEKLLIQDMQDLGVKEISGVLGEQWDHNDPFARDKDNRFTLAYYGFDRTIQLFDTAIEEAKEDNESADEEDDELWTNVEDLIFISSHYNADKALELLSEGDVAGYKKMF